MVITTLAILVRAEHLVVYRTLISYFGIIKQDINKTAERGLKVIFQTTSCTELHVQKLKHSAFFLH